MDLDSGGYASVVGPNAFPPEPLRQYALLADGERGALIGPRGDIGFLCVPRWHDDAVFSALLGGRGCYAVTPATPHFVWGGYYEPGSLVWRSRWVTASQVIECREALAFPGEAHRAVLLRRVEAVDGDTEVTVRLDARAGFDSEPMALRRTADTCWEGRAGSLWLRWSGVPSRVDEEDGALCFLLGVPGGERRDLVLEISDEPLVERLPHAERLWEETLRTWRDEVPELGPSIAPGESLHSCAVLRGLTTRSTGATVAAATTALPERAEQQRDYDYRYAWIRDQCFVGQGAAAAGVTSLLDAAVDFVADRLLADGQDLRPAYTVDGDSVPSQHDLDLPGYPGGAPPYAGNRARHQFQLDSFGEALALLATADGQDRLDDRGWRAAEVAAAAVERRCQESDAGIWELEQRRWTHSALSCAAGLRAAASRRGGELAARWENLAESLVERCRRTARHPHGHWQRSPGDPGADAALLVPPLRGGPPPDDPQTRGTIRAVIDQLTDDGYVYRFRHDERPLHDAEGAFLLSGFHLAMALQQQGERTAALRWFERGRGALGPPGLFTEEYDVVQRQLRGNLPQAFVHGALLECASMLATDDESVGFSQRRREESKR
jgi:alpha,alpha-trehalase